MGRDWGPSWGDEEPRMHDPRDANFYRLQKKAKTSLDNLTCEELREYLRYIDEMVEYVTSRISRRGWISLKHGVETLLKRNDN
jgi:hypothetical protein